VTKLSKLTVVGLMFCVGTATISLSQKFFGSSNFAW